jgi:hypothetical protein
LFLDSYWLLMIKNAPINVLSWSFHSARYFLVSRFTPPNSPNKNPKPNSN